MASVVVSDTDQSDEEGRKYVRSLEERLTARSDTLEEVHMEAAIDAELTDTSASRANPAVAPSQQKCQEKIFDDYVNPNSVDNCLSPYVPTQADRIAAFVSFVGLQKEDVLLDIGCGDGRVCVSAIKLSDCHRAVGLDVSPACIQMARQVAADEGLDEATCSFYELDATIAPQLLLESPLASMLQSVTVVFLYTFPTLLIKLVPLLELLEGLMEKKGKVLKVVTLTYHLPSSLGVTVGDTNERFDFRLYTRMSSKPADNSSW
jgi:SAM-dependent methyltransferase